MTVPAGRPVGAGRRVNPAPPRVQQVHFRTLMALPKVKLSKGRKGRRRSHLALMLAPLQACPQCRHMRRPHTICPNCGHYAGREVIKTD
jgi:large subunit ribosomal protein L32